MAILIPINTKAFSALIIPAGISLMAVLGFNLSKCLSKYLLKAIAVDLAVTIHIMTKKNFPHILSIDWMMDPIVS